MGKIKQIRDMLQKKSNRELYSFLMNVLLVYYEARPAYLLETSEFVHLSDKYKANDLLDIIKDQGLFAKKDILSLEEYPRYWVTKKKMLSIPRSDKKIGEWLGMKDPGNDYYDYKKKRLSLSIIETTTDSNITTEILLGDKNDIENIEHAEQRIKRFNEQMIQHDLPYRFIYVFNQDDGTIKRLQELKSKNIKYMIENKQDYINDFYNALLKTEDTHPLIPLFEHCIKYPTVLNMYLPIYLYVYHVFNEDILKNDDFSSKMLKINEKFADQIKKQSMSSCKTHRKKINNERL